METPRMRPRFALEAECDVDTAIEVIERHLQDESCSIRGTISSPHVVLKLPSELRHFWSPQLSISIDPLDHGARVRCIFSPHPQIWTGFVFTYGTLFMIGLSGTMFGLAELSMGRTPWGLLTPLVTAALAGFVYGAAFIGQGLGATEMCKLKGFLDDCLEEAKTHSRLEPHTALDSARL